jgi:hypothetical protein
VAFDVEFGDACVQPLLRVGDREVVIAGAISSTKKCSSAPAWMLPIGSSMFSVK